MAPACTIGPSRPAGMPHVTQHAMPIVFAIRVCTDKMPFRRQPLRNALTCGMPEPAACGAHSVSSAARVASHTAQPECTRKARPRSPSAT
eukprot:6300239-Prymnesium_polylepis.1